MELHVKEARIILKEGDITQESTSAIVNAANSSLRGGGGVDGAIHRAGGPSILQECIKIGGCPPGEAVITGGGRLKAGHVIHTVGPVWHGGSRGEAKLLSNCYRNSLKIAREHNFTSIAFPSISTGAYGYPVPEAAEVALSTIIDFLDENGGIGEVSLVLFDPTTYRAYAEALKGLEKARPSRRPGS
jgi:O-acetyl-ADP-ribose deacetylase